MVDTFEICPPLSLREIADLNKLRAIAEQRLAPAAAEARETFIEEQTEKLVRRTGMSKRDAARVIECQIGGTLLPDLELPFDDEALAGTTVAEVLKDPAKFVGETLADPLEGVGYGICKAKIMRPFPTPRCWRCPNHVAPLGTTNVGIGPPIPLDVRHFPTFN
jgi:hypothetical protein